MFLRLKILKTAFMGDIKHQSSRHRYRRYRYRRRHRRRESKAERKINIVKGNC
jgi:hypothetical protein